MKYEPDLTKGSECDLDKDFSDDSAMTLTLGLETIKITAQRHSVGEVWTTLDKVERKYALDKQSQMERLITIGHMQNKDLIIF